MKLYTARATPFGRTVEIVAHELGLHDALEIEATTVAPAKPNPHYQEVTPLRKIPALVTDDGTLIVDSAVIAEFLADRAGDRSLFAPDREDRFRILSRYAVARGIAECAVAARYETAVRPQEKRWQDWVDDQLGKVSRALDHFEAAPPGKTERPTVDALALGAALGYLDFRFPDIGWRQEHPQLADFYEKLAAKPSFEATRPE
jgi:glutathione S-transferase